MKISIVGSGYVGLCTGIGFAIKKNHITFVDMDKNKVGAINSGKSTIEELGLQDAMRKARKFFTATTNMNEAINTTDITFLCVGTPSRKNGSIDTSYIEKAAEETGSALKNKNKFHLIIVKSTVVPGTTDKIEKIIEKASQKTPGKDFNVVMNPEFLKEGSALEDFLRPDRIVFGVEDKKSEKIMRVLYRGFGAPILIVNRKTAEMIKYASNTFLAGKISLINEIGNICKLHGIDTYQVANAIGHDKRIGNLFLNAGIGFGGSCFSKDVKAIHYRAKELGYDAKMVREILELNSRQRLKIVDILKTRLGPMKNKKIAVLGLAFKAGTDDVRDSPAIDIIESLLKEKCSVTAYDPQATENFRKINTKISYADKIEEALEGADACLILTDWAEFNNLIDKDFSKMKCKIIIEGRKILDPKKVSNFEGVCW